jgi:hypothetical protein
MPTKSTVPVEPDDLAHVLAETVVAKLAYGAWRVIGICGGRTVPPHVRAWLEEVFDTRAPVGLIAIDTARVVARAEAL